MKKVMNVEGIMCPHCEAKVQKALGKLEGVESVAASHETGKVEVVCNKEIANEVLAKTVEDLDYKVIDVK